MGILFSTDKKEALDPLCVDLLKGELLNSDKRMLKSTKLIVIFSILLTCDVWNWFSVHLIL